MKTFQCQNCEYEVEARKLPDDYKCPECGGPREELIIIRKKRGLLLLFLYSITLLMLIISGSFTLSTIYNHSKKPHSDIHVGELSLELVEQNDTTIRLYNTSPMSDEKAKSLKPFQFKLNNNGTYALNYVLKLKDVPNSELTRINEIIGKTRINNSKVKFSLIDTNTNKVIKQGFVSDLENETLLSGKVKASNIDSYALRLWIDKNVGNEDQNKFYAGRIELTVYENISCNDKDCDDDCDRDCDDEHKHHNKKD